MRIGQLQSYIVRHYYSRRREDRRYGILILGSPGIGKSMSVELAAREIAEKLELEFIKITVRWSSEKKRFVINTEGEHDIEQILNESEKFFVFTDFRLKPLREQPFTFKISTVLGEIKTT